MSLPPGKVTVLRMGPMVGDVEMLTDRDDSLYVHWDMMFVGTGDEIEAQLAIVADRVKHALKTAREGVSTDEESKA